MKISTLLDHIDSGHMALPEFQRGYVWNRDQVRALFHPGARLLQFSGPDAQSGVRAAPEGSRSGLRMGLL
jgi:hypothetical protein